MSQEWCVLSSISTPFSVKGDSGSIVFDLSGRIGGILNGGIGDGHRNDITYVYVTPMEWLLEDSNKHLEMFGMAVCIL